MGMWPNAHLLVNFAGYFGSKCIIAEKDQDKSHKTFSVNVVSYFNIFQAHYLFMKEMKGVDKPIVNIASISELWVPSNHWTNADSKDAILIMTNCMALDLFVNGIGLNSISPAWMGSMIMKLPKLQWMGDRSGATMETLLCAEETLWNKWSGQCRLLPAQPRCIIHSKHRFASRWWLYVNICRRAKGRPKLCRNRLAANMLLF